MGAIAGFGFLTLLGVGLGILSTIIGLFFNNIIVFNSIAFGIISGFLSHGLLHVHPLFAILIAVGVFFLFFFVQNTKVGFWIISSLISLAWGGIFSLIAHGISKGDPIWTYGILIIGTVIIFLLHKKAYDEMN